MERPTRRTYGQYCALAQALDIVGERWTLLIVRELLVRPRRYAELLDALNGMGTNLLAERLRLLTEAGVIRQVDPRDRRSGYELTERGRALQGTVLALARWGLDVMADLVVEGTVQAGWALLGVQALIDDARASDVDEDYLFLVSGETFTVSVRAGHAEAHDGPATEPAITVSTDATTLIDIGARRMDPIAALVAGRLAVTASDPDAMLRCLHLLGLHEGPARAAGSSPAAEASP